MLIACWSVKGGSGTTVVSAALAMLLARSSRSGALLVDLAGDAPGALGVAESDGPGIGDWMATPAADRDSIERLAVEAGPGLRLVPRGRTGPAGGGERLAAALAGPAATVVDCGTATEGGPALAVASSAAVSLLVLRPCYLALRRALAAPVRPSGVVVVAEAGRSLTADDVGEVLGVPVRAVVDWQPAIARAVDAGLLGGRLPRSLLALRAAA